MFKPGDWIIATEKFELSNGCNDRSFMDDAVEIVDVTPHHIVYRSSFGPFDCIIPIDRVTNQKFILADESIKEASKKRRSQWYTKVDEQAEEKITGWDEW